jgi:hypothetical protein
MSLNIGDKVCYVSSHGKMENGVVKAIPPDCPDSHVRVVYHCVGDWDNYAQYTSALTAVKDLIQGWIRL